MEIEHLEWLWLIIPLLIVWIIWLMGFRNQWKSLIKYFGETSLHTLIPGFSPDRKTTKMAFILAGLIFLVLALANPRMGMERSEIETEMVNVILAIDLSYSMLANDRSPSRLEVAKQRAVELVDMLPGNRYALIAFSGVSQIVMPLTTDQEVVKMRLRLLKAGMMAQQGTSFGLLLEEASTYLDETGSGVLVILSDGEDHDGRIDAGVERFSEKNYPIFSIALGTDQGTAIPDLGGKSGQMKRDLDGNIILSRMELNTLSELAESTSGHLVTNPGISGMQEIAEQIGAFKRGGIAQGTFVSYANYHPYLLLLALICFASYLFWPNGRKIISKNPESLKT